MKASRYKGSVVFALAMTVVAAAIAVAAATLAGGCAKDEGRERSGKAVGSLKDTRSEVAAAEAGDEVLAAAAAVRNGQGDLNKAYDKYKKEVTETERRRRTSATRPTTCAPGPRSTRTSGRRRVQGQRPGPEGRVAGAGGEGPGSVRHDRGQAQDAKAAYQPFIQALKDVQTYCPTT